MDEQTSLVANDNRSIQQWHEDKGGDELETPHNDTTIHLIWP